MSLLSNLQRYIAGLGMGFLVLAIASPASAQVFSQDAGAATGTITEGSGQALYGNFGLGADASATPANTYNVYRKVDVDITDGLSPLTDFQTLTPDAGNNSLAQWDNLYQGGPFSSTGGGGGFGAGFKAPGMFIGTTPGTSSYSNQLNSFGAIVDPSKVDPGSIAGDQNGRRDWDVRVGFLETPADFISGATANSVEQDLHFESHNTDSVYMELFLGSSNRLADVADPGDTGGNADTGNTNWYTRTKTVGDPAETTGFWGQSAAGTVAEDDRTINTMTRRRAGSGTAIAESSEINVDVGVGYDALPELKWDMELNDPGATAGTQAAREVKFSVKVGNVVYDGVFDPGDAANPKSPNNVFGSADYSDGFFDWQNATPVFFLGAQSGSGEETSAVQGVFHPADFDASGATDVTDLNVWITNSFTVDTTFSTGDATQDGTTDVSDLNVWITNQFTTADGVPGSGVPDFTYDPATGELTVSADGQDVSTFKVPVEDGNILSVVSGDLPGAGACFGSDCWNVVAFNDAVQGFDTTIVQPGGPLFPISGNDSLLIAQLAIGLTAADFGAVEFADGSGTGLTIVSVVPEPSSIALVAMGLASVLASVRRRSS